MGGGNDCLGCSNVRHEKGGKNMGERKKKRLVETGHYWVFWRTTLCAGWGFTSQRQGDEKRGGKQTHNRKARGSCGEEDCKNLKYLLAGNARRECGGRVKRDGGVTPGLECV